MDNQIKIEDWGEELLRLANQTSNTNENGEDVWVIEFNTAKSFISTLLKSQRESRDKELREKWFYEIKGLMKVSKTKWEALDELLDSLLKEDIKN